MRSILRQRTVTLLAVTGALAVALCGCTPDQPAPSTVPSPSSSDPPFATDEDALAAAQSAYEEFMAVTKQIMADDGASPERLDSVAAPGVAIPEKEAMVDFVARHLTVEGASAVTGAVLQSYSPEATDGRGIVRAYLCVNVSAVDVLDENGVSVVQPTRPDETPFEVTFDLVEADSPRLIVSGKNQWGGSGIC